MHRYKVVISFVGLIVISSLVLQCSDSSTFVDPGDDINGNDTDPPAEFSHTQGPGESGEAFITDNMYDQLVEEIQYMPAEIGPSRTKIESTVFAHEFGHLMGLVNNGIDAQDGHHDS